MTQLQKRYLTSQQKCGSVRWCGLPLFFTTLHHEQ
ncbi:Protein of unknown function, partial [Gryllus bimaculatus]